MSGILYVVGTPIGNLGDFSPRGAQILEEVDFICAEDTRVSRKLLSAFSIHQTMVSLHEHNIAEKIPQIVERLINGESGAVITDAGMPCISDPGQQLVRALRQREMRVCVVPGPTAALSALAISGLPTDRFYFEGFLPREKKARKERLTSLSTLDATLIFYEAPHRIIKMLTDIRDVMGDREICLARELTKKFEEVSLTTAALALKKYDETPPKGEFVVLVHGADSPSQNCDELTVDDAISLCNAFMSEGLSLSKAAAKTAAQTSFSKSLIYSKMLEQKQV